MSRLILRTVWAQQPQQAVAIDPWWLGQGLLDVIDMTGVPRSLILGTPASTFGTMPKFGAASDRGRTLDTSSAFGGVYFQRSDGAYTTAEQTHVSVARFDAATGAYAGLFDTADGSGANNCLSLQAASGGSDLLTYAGGTGNTLTGAGTTILGTGFSVIALSAGPNYCELFRNGVSLSTKTGITVPTYSTSRLVLFGERTASSSYAVKGKSALHLVFKSRLSPALHRVLAANPWRVFKAPDARIWVPVSPGGGITIAPGTGHAVLAGKTATIAQPNTVAPSAAHVALTGHAPTVSQSAAIVVNPGAGHVALTGSVPGISQPRTVAPGVGHALLAGKPPIIVQAITLSPGSGHIVVAGTAPGVAQSSGMTLFPGIAHAVLAGKTPGIAQPNNIAPNTGHAVFAGKAPAVDSSAPLTDAEKIALILQILENRQTLNPVTGLFTLYADDGTTVLKTAQAWEDTAATIPYRGQGLQRLDALQ